MTRIGIWTLALALICNVSAQADYIGLYTFDDGTARDVSGNGNHGVIYGATFTPDGRSGGGFDFDDGAAILIPIDVSPAALPQMTWGAWFRASGRLDNPGEFEHRTILSLDTAGYDRTLTIDTRIGDEGGNPLAVGAFAGTNTGLLNTGIVPVVDEWYFVAASYDESLSSMTLYVGLQGQSQTLAFDSTTTFDDFSFPFFLIGNNPAFLAEYFTGTIDEVFVAGRVMSKTEIDRLFVRGSVIPEPASLVSLGIGLLGTVGFAWRRSRGLPRFRPTPTA